MSDTDLAERIRALLKDTPFHGEGYRKVWARLRYSGVRTSPTHYTTQGWLRAAGWIQRDDSDQGNVRCQTEPLPPSREYCAPRLT
jgi:hypothetical protein